MSGKYDDILSLPRPVSRTHAPMPREERAAQFSPFAALTGFENVISEAGRLTARRVILDEDARQELDLRLNRLAARTEPPGEPVPVELTWFEPDPQKLGGEYRTEVRRVRRVDRTYRLLELEDRSVIELEQLLELRGEAVE